MGGCCRCLVCCELLTLLGSLLLFRSFAYCLCCMLHLWVGFARLFAWGAVGSVVMQFCWRDLFMGCL